jgi:signal transduction histidine kinase
MFVVWGAQGSLLYNDGYIPLLGGKHPQALWQTFQEVWAEVWDSLSGLVTSVFSGKSVSSEDIFLMLDRGGGLKEAHFAYSYTPVRDDAGVVLGLFCACTETTAAVFERHGADRDRRRLAQMFDQAPGFMCLTEGPDHRFVLSNRAHRRLIDNRDVIGLTLAQALPEAVDQGFVALMDRVYRRGEAFSAKSMVFLVQATSIAPVRQRIIDVVYQPLTNARGEVTGIFAEGIDVTERAAAEADLRRSQEHLNFALAAGRFGTWSLDIETQEYLSSAVHRQNFGRDPDLPFTYRDLIAAIHADDLAERFATIAQSIIDNVDYEFEHRILTPAGEMRWLSVLAHTTYAPDGTALNLVGLSSDVTARKALEHDLRSLNEELEERVAGRTAELNHTQAALRQAQKMEAVGQLTGGIAHDFNNLLMGIGGSLDMLQARLAQGRFEAVPRYVVAAQSAVTRAAALTHRLLAFSRRQTLDPKPVALNQLVLGMEDLIRRTVGPDITMHVTSHPDLWRTLVDPHQFENALLNLCINARDAMPDGGALTINTVNATIEARSATDWNLPAGDYTSLCVTDTGCGMTPEVMSRAFDPFFTTKPLGQGTGLGLSMIYGFVLQSGGEVRIHSKVKRGTAVCIYLPRCIGDAEIFTPVGPLLDEVLGGHGETVLVVDDEATVRTLISEVLQDAGYKTIEADDGPAGMNVLQSGARVDLLITDVGLPGGMNGRQVADAGRVLRPDLKVLFVTGYAENAVVRNGRLEDGMQILTKPFSVGVLGSKVRTLIDS